MQVCQAVRELIEDNMPVCPLALGAQGLGSLVEAEFDELQLGFTRT